MQELETVFRGAGWNVIKLLWSRDWDPILARDAQGLLRRRLNESLDGHMQRFRAESGGYLRKHLFGTSPELLELVADYSDDQLKALRRGGHDLQKIHAAFRRAVDHQGRPTVVLAHTVKGFALGEGFEAKNVTHQIKKLSLEQLKDFRDRLDLPFRDDQLADPPYFHPGAHSPEVQYLKERREALGGPLPSRKATMSVSLALPENDLYQEFYEGTKNPGGVSTTMAFVRLLTKLLKDEGVGRRVVPIIPDEARTFGMEPLFRQVGIYAAHGQLYEPVDRSQLLYYRETKDGQVLEEGITEAGSMASFTAAGTAYATHGQPMIPFYIFYSMFGFQRTGDQIWAFGDARGRGFLMGATAGRTALNGEGLQHQDGHSHVLAATVPNVQAYDPAYAYEIAIIVEDGLRRMYGEQEDVFYYVTIHNENYKQAPLPGSIDTIRDGVLRGLYLFRPAKEKRDVHVNLFGSGSILKRAREAQKMLDEDFGISADLWSATSYQQLRRDALACDRWNRLHPTAEQPRVPYVRTLLEDVDGPILAVSDFMKLVPDQIAPVGRPDLRDARNRRLRHERHARSPSPPLRDRCGVDRHRRTGRPTPRRPHPRRRSRTGHREARHQPRQAGPPVDLGRGSRPYVIRPRLRDLTVQAHVLQHRGAVLSGRVFDEVVDADLGLFEVSKVPRRPPQVIPNGPGDSRALMVTVLRQRGQCCGYIAAGEPCQESESADLLLRHGEVAGHANRGL